MNSSKKNGFTLIELLVVMILIAVLGLFIYPTIINLYNSSKKNIFLTESKSIYKICMNEYRASVMSPTSRPKTSIRYDDDTKIKEISDEYKYCVKLDDKGVVTEIKVATAKYYIEGNDKFEQHTIENVKYGVFEKFNCDYELQEEDIRKEITVEQIRGNEKYKNALKYLLVAFGVALIVSLIASRKAR